MRQASQLPENCLSLDSGHFHHDPSVRFAVCLSNAALHRQLWCKHDFLLLIFDGNCRLSCELTGRCWASTYTWAIAPWHPCVTNLHCKLSTTHFPCWALPVSKSVGNEGLHFWLRAKKMSAAIAVRRICHNWVFQPRKLLVPIRIEWMKCCLLATTKLRYSKLFQGWLYSIRCLVFADVAAVGSTSRWYGWSRVDGLDNSDEVAVLESITN